MMKKTFEVYFYQTHFWTFGAVSKQWIEKENIAPEYITRYGMEIFDRDISDFLETLDLSKPKVAEVTIEFKETACNEHYKLKHHNKTMLEALKDVKKQVEESEYWWMDCPNKGGIDLKKIDDAIKGAEANDACNEHHNKTMLEALKWVRNLAEHIIDNYGTEPTTFMPEILEMINPAIKEAEANDETL